ncbi:MAG: hypothetical protein HYT48_03510 [Candidatus Vogelbacteria bacterium]|nr:hypothetical protein [Candidatus Vogelbacteria bacterium]
MSISDSGKTVRIYQDNTPRYSGESGDFVDFGWGGDGFGGMVRSVRYFEKTLSITASGFGDDPQDQKIGDQILATFKFTYPTSVIDPVSALKEVTFTLPVGVKKPDPSTGQQVGETQTFIMGNDPYGFYSNGVARLGDVVYYFDSPLVSASKENIGLVIVNAGYGASMTDVYLVLVGDMTTRPKQLTYADLWNHPNLKNNPPYKIGLRSVEFKNDGIVEVTTSLRYGNNFSGYDSTIKLRYQLKDNQLIPLAVWD